MPSVPRADTSRVEASRQGIVPRQLPVRDRYLSPPRNTELLAQDIAVSLRGSGRDPEWLQGYLNEYAWRYNHRDDEAAMFKTLLLRATVS